MHCNFPFVISVLFQLGLDSEQKRIEQFAFVKRVYGRITTLFEYAGKSVKKIETTVRATLAKQDK